MLFATNDIKTEYENIYSFRDWIMAQHKDIQVGISVDMFL